MNNITELKTTSSERMVDTMRSAVVNLRRQQLEQMKALHDTQEKIHENARKMSLLREEANKLQDDEGALQRSLSDKQRVINQMDASIEALGALE